MEKIKIILRNAYLMILGRSLILNKKIEIEATWYGNTYGGFYLYPNILTEKSIIYSFGIGEDVSFDKAIINQFNCDVYGFDPTPKSIKWVESSNIDEKFNFYSYGISDKSGFETFYLPRNTNYVSGSTVNMDNVNNLEPIQVPMKNITAIMKEFNHDIIDVIKMDIEGAEYKVIEDILSSNIIVKQLCIEFHHRMIERGANKTKAAINLLNEHGFKLFAFSDTYEELSFMNTKYI